MGKAQFGPIPSKLAANRFNIKRYKLGSVDCANDDMVDCLEAKWRHLRSCWALAIYHEQSRQTTLHDLEPLTISRAARPFRNRSNRNRPMRLDLTASSERSFCAILCCKISALSTGNYEFTFAGTSA
jgi:hypothetical protein